MEKVIPAKFFSFLKIHFDDLFFFGILSDRESVPKVGNSFVMRFDSLGKL